MKVRTMEMRTTRERKTGMMETAMGTVTRMRATLVLGACGAAFLGGGGFNEAAEDPLAARVRAASRNDESVQRIQTS